MLHIPKIFHRIWLGPAPFPPEFMGYGRSWMAKHPGWEFRWWTDENRPRPLINEGSFQRAATPAQRADILRYELVYVHGGVYIDTDFECLRSIEPLLEGLTFFAAGERPGMASIGIFGAAAEDIILHDAIRAVPGRIAKHRWPNQATGPGLLTAALQPWLKYADVRLFGPDLFYPLPYSPAGRAEIDGNNAARVAAAYAVHHWAGSWLSSMEGKPP